jgi:hypothetical protein
MARFLSDEVLDGGPDKLKSEVDAVAGEIVICEGTPTTYEHANSDKGTGAGMVLARKVNPTLTLGEGAVDGRKVTISEELAIDIDFSGTADHIALTDGVDTLHLVTPGDAQALVAGGTVDIGAFVVTVRDPVAPA